MKILSLPLCVAFLFPALTAGADTISAVATFENVGVEVRLDAPPPPGTTVSMAIKEAASPGAYRPIHPLSRVADDVFAGSAFRLDPGTAYSIRLSSPAFPGDRFVGVTTRADAFPDATGTTYHVAPSGDDAHTGLSVGQAFRTVAKALAVAQAGDEVQLHDGRYYEGGLSAPRSGTATQPIVLRNAPGARPVLDGTDPTFAPAWTLHDAPHHVYRTPTSKQPRNAYVDGTHLYRYNSLADLTADPYGVSGAYYADGSHLYVRFPNNDPPAGHAVTIPRHTTGLTIENKHHLQLRGIEFAYYGYGDFHRGVYLDGADENLITGCSFHHTGIGVALKRGADFNVIQDSTFDESPAGEWSWLAVKVGAEDYELGAVFVYGSTTPNQGNVVRRNRIENMTDGAHLYSHTAAGPTTNMDFHDNVLRNLVDDGIETDGAGSNNRIYNNRIENFLTGISIAPAQGGPTYLLRNVLADWHSDPSGNYEGYPFKFNVSSSLTIDWVYLYHNTATTATPGQDGFLFKGYSDWQNVFSRNNLYAGTRYALESWPGFDHPVDFDYDNLYTTDPVRFIRWAGTYYSLLAAFTAATGHEEHGVALPPGFVDASGGDYHLAADSGMIDRGIVIPGVNDDFFGSAPDLGAYEYGQVPEPSPVPLVVVLVAGLAGRGRLRRRS